MLVARKTVESEVDHQRCSARLICKTKAWLGFEARPGDVAGTGHLI